MAALLCAYRIGSTRFQERCLEELGRSTDVASLISATGLRSTDSTAAYIDGVSEELVSAYEVAAARRSPRMRIDRLIVIR